MQVKINQSVLRQELQKISSHLLTKAIEEGILVAKENVAIDTSSLRESIRMGEIEINGDKISAQIIAGGEDYTGQIMPGTGKRGNVIDYAIDQEIKTGFLSSAIPAIIESLTTS
jgi:hypothetical protein